MKTYKTNNKIIAFPTFLLKAYLFKDIFLS